MVSKIDEFEGLEPLPEDQRQGRKDDSEHCRLFGEGWRWSTNLGNEDIDGCTAELQGKGYEVCICQSAHDGDGNFLPEMVSCWIKKLSEANPVSAVSEAIL